MNPSNPAQRARLVQAYTLRSQGLTLRQIGEQMDRAPSTVGHYLREFERHRAEIVQHLAADQLVNVLQRLDQADSDLHPRHVSAARELRLLLNSLDQVEDRQQKRERRIRENEIHDHDREFADIEEIVRIMLETGHWDPNDDIDHLLEPLFGPRSQPSVPAPERGPTPVPAPERGPTPVPASRGNPLGSPSSGGAPKRRRGHAQSPQNPTQTPAKSANNPPKSAQNRTKSNKTEQKSVKRPPVQSPPRPKRNKPRRPQNQLPIPAYSFGDNDIYEPPFSLKNLRPLDPDDPRHQKFFGNR